MFRRAPPPEYYEDEYEVDREKYPRSRRSERTYDEMEYRRRKVSPPIEDMGRMRIRDRPPREFVRETIIVPPRNPGPPVYMRRSVEDILPSPDIEEEHYRARQSRRSHRARDRETDDEEAIAGGRSRRARRPRASPTLDEEEELAIRRRGEVPPFEYESEAERRPRERRFSDIQDEVIVRSSDLRRKPRRLEEEFEADLVDAREERPRRPKYRTDPPDPNPLSKEEEKKVRSRVMEWQDQPSPQERAEEEAELRALDMRHGNRRSDSRTRYERGPPGAWPDGPDDENYETDARSRSRKLSGSGRDEIQVEEVDTHRETYGRGRRRRSTEIEEIIIRKDRRRGSLQERDPSPESVRVPPILKEVVPHHRHIDHGLSTKDLYPLKLRANRHPGFDNVRPRGSGSEKASTHASYDEVDMYHQSQRGGRRSEENISYRRQEKDANSPISPGTSFRSAEFRNPWKTDERRSRQLQSLARETESLAESTQGRSRRSQRHEIVEDEIHMRETRSKPRSAVGDIKRERVDDWSVVHVPRKEEPLRMPGGLDFVEMVPKDDPVKENVKEPVLAEFEIEERSRAMPEHVKGRRDERWTEITKDLVVRDAIERCGYEFEETTQFYYIFSYLETADIDELLELSDEIRLARRQRIREMHRERAAIPPRSASLVDRRVPRVPWSGERRVREREWVIDSHH